MPAASRPRQAAAADRKFVTALARGLDVLRCFGPRDRWLTNNEIARRTGLAKPTVSRLTYTLTRLGHLRYSETLNQYALGGSAVSIGFAALGQIDIRRLARPLMQALAEQTATAVHFAVNDRQSMVLIDTYRNTDSFVVDIGARLPIPTSSTGRAYLCALPPPQRRKLIEELRAQHPDEWAQTSRALEQAMAEYEEHGYCLSLGDWRREVHALAVPLVPAEGWDPVVFLCSGAAFQLDEARLRTEIAPRLLTLVGNVRSVLNAD